MIWAPPRRRATRRPAVATSRVAVAASRVVEALESRVFLHAGEAHLVPTATFPTNGAQQVAKSVDVTIRFAADVNPATLTASTFELRDAGNNLVPAAVSYDATTRTAKLNPTADFATTNNYYYAKVKGGVDGVKDAAGNTIDGDVRWSFTPGAAQFTEQTLLPGLVGPVTVQFAPDGRVFVAERSGLIRVFASTTATTSTVFADLRTQVHNFWDRGLLGLALHPNFPQQPYVYVLYTFDADVGGTAPKYGSPDVTSDPGPDATGSGALVSGRLSRLTVSNNGAGNTMVAGSEQVLINDWQQQFPSHSVGSIAFGPDGALYASAGDGASFNYADYGQTGNPFNDPANEGGAVRSQDLRTPGDPTSLDGSIIRIDPATGLALPDNPNYAAGPDANAKRIVAHGFRNPFRFTFRPGTNEIWAGDVGWGTWEEIDRVQLGTPAVLNYGWPAYEGPNRQGGYDNLNLPVLEGLYAAGPGAVVAPYYAYQHSQQVVSGSGEPTGGSSVSGVAFYDGGSYPAAYDGALFFSDYSRRAIYVMYRGLDGLPDPTTRQVVKVGTIGPTQLLTGPNGDLYYVDHLGKALKRFAFQSTNAPPTAVIGADRTTGAAPLTVRFSAAGSTDPNPGETFDYAWDLDGDGAYDDSTDVAPTFTYTAAGTYTVRLRVTDRAGAVGTASLAVRVGNSAPVPTITSPLAGLRWKVGDVVSFGGGATDLQDGTLGAANLKWSLIVRHESLIDPSSYHEHLVQEWVGVSSGSFVAPDHEYPSKLELRLTATDSGGLSTTTAVVLQPMTSTFTVQSNVPGVQVGFNGELATTPFNRTVIVGSTNSVTAAGQAVGGTAYDFAGWSDGGAATHQVVAGAANGSLTATYAASAALPVPWASADVGAVGLAGSVAYANGGFTLRGAGADVWGTEDSFRYAYQQVTGDATIVARVASIPPAAQGSAKFGVQFRAGLSADAANVQVDLEGPGTWGEFHDRDAAGAATNTAAFFGVGVPRWLKLVRQGDAFTAFQSADGQAWAQVGQATVPMGQSVYVGMVVCSHDVTALNTATFDNVSVVAATTNAAPTIVAAAAAAVAANGKSASLSVAAADDAGEAALSYAWSRVSGPGAVTFAPNGTNAAKTAGATFTLAGTYVLRATATDAGGKSVASDVTVTVAQVLTDVGVAPPSASLANGQTRQFAALARDQFGSAMAAQPTFAWSIDAGGLGTVSATGLYTAPASGTGGATVRATGGGRAGTSGVTVYAAGGDVTLGLVDRWAFDEGTGLAAADAVGGNAGTLVAGTGWTPGKLAGGVSLDGIDDRVSTATNLGSVLGGTSTLTAWVKTTQAGGGANFWETPGIAGVEEHWGNDDVFWGYLTPTGRVAVQAGDGAAAASTTAVNDGQWHHVAFTRDAATGALQAFVDGVLQGTAAGETGLKSVPFNSIGRIEATVGPAAYFAGALDEVRIYNRVLTAAEVVAVRDAGPAVPPPPPANAAPTVAAAAKATPSAPYAGVATAVAALGADDGGEPKLTYAWSVTTAPAGATVAFGATGTNAAKGTTATFSAAGTYALRCTIGDGTLSVTTGVTVTVAAFSSAKVNFQPAAAATVAGYVVEGGAAFGARNNSLSFGWNTSHTASTYDRGKNANQLLDTVTLMKAGAKWEVAVPSGTYSVKVGVGDANAAATNTIRVEGTALFSAAATAANAFQNKTVSVKVTDGRLTIDNGSAADLKTALDYVEFTRTGA